MEPFVAFDVETACPTRCSICALGAVRATGDMVADSLYTLVDPDCAFSDFNTRLHGIDAQAVQGAPTFGMIWPEVRAFFGGLPLVAYNASFDLDCLGEAADRCGLQLPPLPCFDALAIARGAGLGLSSYTLDSVASALGLGGFAHHNAAQDAEVTALVVLALADRLGAATLAQLQALATIPQAAAPSRASGGSHLNPYTRAPREPGSIHVREVEGWRGKAVCVTGDFADYAREDVLYIIAQLGAVPKSGVSARTHLLLVAHADLAAVAEQGRPMTAKHAKAHLHGIPIMDELDFLAAVLGL